jgi:hypothetical protein
MVIPVCGDAYVQYYHGRSERVRSDAMGRLLNWMDRQPLKWPRILLYILAANAVVAATYGLGTMFRAMKAGQ